MALQLNRDALRDAGACNLDHYFDTTPNASNGVIDYPNGWQDADSVRVATEKPLALLWLARHKVIPITVVQAKTFVAAAHPDKSFQDLVVEFHRAKGDLTPPP